MSKYSNNGRRHNHEVLSPCTKVQIYSMKSINWWLSLGICACLLGFHPKDELHEGEWTLSLLSWHNANIPQTTTAGYCGNGLVEEGEECDCGDEFQCLVTRSCCYPPTGGEDNMPCSARYMFEYSMRSLCFHFDSGSFVFNQKIKLMMFCSQTP